MAAKAAFGPSTSASMPQLDPALTALIEIVTATLANKEQQDGCLPGDAVHAAMLTAVKVYLAEQARREGRKVLRIAAVEEKTGRKKSWIYDAARNRSFPAPISLGGRASGWLSSDIDAWLDQQIKASRNPEVA